MIFRISNGGDFEVPCKLSIGYQTTLLEIGRNCLTLATLSTGVLLRATKNWEMIISLLKG